MSPKINSSAYSILFKAKLPLYYINFNELEKCGKICVSNNHGQPTEHYLT